MAKIERVKNKRHEIIHPFTSIPAVEGLENALDTKQAALVSGDNIKTVNGHTLLGSGNLNITGSGDVIIVDTEMSPFSENPVQNKVIYNVLSSLSDRINAVKQFRYESVDSLPMPPSEETMGVIYLVPASIEEEKNTKEEYITVRSGEEGSYLYSWEKIGTTAVDLTDYSTKEYVTTSIEAALASYISNVYSPEDGTIILELTNGDSIIVDINHKHPENLKYQMCEDEQEYEDIEVKDSETLYLIPEI